MLYRVAVAELVPGDNEADPSKEPKAKFEDRGVYDVIAETLDEASKLAFAQADASPTYQNVIIVGALLYVKSITLKTKASDILNGNSHLV